ncbi:MAG: hypothetical protein Q4G36_04335 [Paracoccus sp. (in: a-proteobacteria)]|nr:hypothetical protein [Paracoccus sp. (in: a-proteobacteria)]
MFLPARRRLAKAEAALREAPSLETLRSVVGPAAKAGQDARAGELLSAIPRFRWHEDGPDSTWHDAMTRRLGGAVPRAEPASRLVLAFAFPPFSNSSGNVMARRIMAEDVRVDVISNDMSGREGLDLPLYRALAPLIGQHLVLDAPNEPANAAAFAEFAEKAKDALRSGRFGRTHYDSVYSRAMWAQSHFAAAALLADGRAARWIAEFSDPCHLDLEGRPAGPPADDAWLESVGIAPMIRAAGFETPTGRKLMFWAEYMAFCLADEVIFTNEIQRDVMLAQPEIPEPLRQRVARVGRIMAQPVPGPAIMAHVLPAPPRDDAVWIGYFGASNPRRGLGALLDAVAALPPDLRGVVRVQIHGRADPRLPLEIERLGLGDAVQIGAPLDYLASLGQMAAMDYLFINDTERGAAYARSPYLPSKLADYESAGRPLIAFADPGSTLWARDLPPGSIRVDMTQRDECREVVRAVAQMAIKRLCSAR